MGNIITFCKRINNLVNEHEMLKLSLYDIHKSNYIFNE